MTRVDIPKDKQKILHFILSTQDLYKILHVTRDAKEEDITKQYKKLTLLVHPDRNTDPKATDAFKKLSEAKRILSDPKSRERYDLTGSTSDRPSAIPFSPWNQPDLFSNGPAGAFQYDDIFAALFSSATSRRPFLFQNGPASFQTRTFSPGASSNRFHFFSNAPPHPNTYRTQPNNPMSSFTAKILQLLPLLIFFYFFWQMQQSYEQPPQFKLSKTSVYNVPYKTLKHGIPYWMTTEFNHSIFLDSTARQQFEKQVFQDWQRWKESECNYERKQPHYKYSVPPACTQLKAILQHA